MRKKLLGALSLFLTTALWSNIALADGWPTSVVGSWTIVGNQSPGFLNITSQAGSGMCRRILGNIYGNPIDGFYCPFSGRIHFIRKHPATNDTIQSWTGNLSMTGFPLRMGGTFAVSSPGGGSFGEYNFHGVK